MPEAPKLFLMAKFVQKCGKDLTFEGDVDIPTRKKLKWKKVKWHSSSYTLSAESRGKEMKVHLKDKSDPKKKKHHDKDPFWSDGILPVNKERGSRTRARSNEI